ncbi:MAG: exodeoxyribonuclease VII large subunit [bacterium]|nr:exodeoxyribonuclease VII large subunit [bacterium]
MSRSQWLPPGASEDQYEARGHRQDVPLSISQLNWYIKNLLEQSVPKVWVEGEISDLSRPSSGHLYFTLKDDQSQVRGVIWRSTAARMKFQLKDGMAVVCCGAVEVYPPRGSYQLIVNQVHPQGVGPLQLAFQQLHEKLSAQGLFAPERKKALPRFPKRIGIISSPSGAAVHDFLEAAKDRWSDVHLMLIPSRVQGEQASADIVKAIELAHRLRPRLDILVLSRGGGSMEDLWCFNEETVVRAVSNASIPTVSAIGHEIDVTLCDLVADVRALTPTHAAHIVLPNRDELAARLTQIGGRLNRALRSRSQAMRLRLDGLTHRGILTRPHELHKARRQMIDELEMQAHEQVRDVVGRRQDRIRSLARALEALSPLNVLARGYSLSRKHGSPLSLRSVEQISAGEMLETRLMDGTLLSTVASVEPLKEKTDS